jgi:aconitase A
VREDDTEIRFEAVVRLNSAVEVAYLRHGGILPRVLRMFLGEQERQGG